MVAKLEAGCRSQVSLAEVPRISRSSPRKQPCTPGLQCGATPTESTASLCLLDQEGEDSQSPRPHNTALPGPPLHHLTKAPKGGATHTDATEHTSLLLKTMAEKRKWVPGRARSVLEWIDTRGTKTRGGGWEGGTMACKVVPGSRLSIFFRDSRTDVPSSHSSFIHSSFFSSLS